ncbi:hypothetical protein NQ176_g1108 [Zarea fungicola]|uniref:Uncharacterized protein n=1 Tax=Zarea fungicola TaxID=93591 RepID=A0ACC1NVG6_9HYPO|nr:hypothetical protein NQ176_g1108 [Lecanicillium fungicola]
MDDHGLRAFAKAAAPPQLPQQNGNEQNQGEDDKSYQVYLERAFADPRFRTTLAQIFDKYDQKAARANEAIDPALCGIMVADDHGVGSAAHENIASTSNGFGHNENMPYHLDTIGDQHVQVGIAGTAEYQVDGLNDATGSNTSGFPAPPYVPNLAGNMHPNLLQDWYGNPFHVAGSHPSLWDGSGAHIHMPQIFTGANGPWMAPNGFAYDPAPWPAPVAQASQAVSTSEPPPPAQQTVLEGPQQLEKDSKAATEEESTDNCQDTQALDVVGQRRRPMQPRFSKNGKRLGRPPKSADTCTFGAPSTKNGNDSPAYDGEGEDNGGITAGIAPPADLGDDDKGATETDMDPRQAEAMLLKIQKQLIDRAVRRATMAEEQDDSAEGRRRSGREKKKVNFGEQVSWERVSAERRASYKIKMHLRALSVQARRERKKKEKDEAEQAAEEKRLADELAAAAAEEAAAEPSAPEDNPGGQEGATTLPSTIPDSQDTVTTLAIRTTPQKPQAKQIMRQTIKNHVNSVVHFEEDDDAPLNEEELSAFPVKKPIFSFPKKPTKPINSFLGENYMDTVYALSDDESPALLDSMKRISIRGKKNEAPNRVILPHARPASTSPERCLTNNENRNVEAPAVQTQVTKQFIASSVDSIIHVPQEPTLDIEEADLAAPELSALPIKQVQPAEASGATLLPGGDAHDSGIDISSEQAPSDQAQSLQGEIGRMKKAFPTAEMMFQDPDLMSAADLLDSLDVMSEAGDILSSPIAKWKPAELVTTTNDLPAVESAMPENYHWAPFVDEELDFGGMDVSEQEGKELPTVRDKTPDNQEVGPSEPTMGENSAKKNTQMKATLTEQLHPAKPSLIFVEQKFNIETLSDAKPSLPAKKLPEPSTRRHPLPQQGLPKKSKDRRLSSSRPKECRPKEHTPSTSIPKAPSPSFIAERSKLPSPSLSRASAPESRASSAKRASLSSSRRSLLSLVDGGSGVGTSRTETRAGRKNTSQKTLKFVQTATPTQPASSSLSREASSSFHRKTKPSSTDSSSLPRVSLGSFSTVFSREAPKSSKERKEAKERRRKSASNVAATATTTTAMPEAGAGTSAKRGTCGVDGYTCGRDFCFTCL